MKKLMILLLIFTSLISIISCNKTTTTTTTTEKVIEYALENAVLYEVNIRNYTEEGTFSAFETHLPRLKELGVDILWLMPIHPISVTRRIGSLGSWYSIADYYGINPEFGNSADFEHLITTAHSMGFKVILDIVANHSGWDNDWITDHKDWYTQNSNGDIVIPPGTNWNDVADLNYSNAALQTEMINVLKYWVTEYDIDGYRADYAGGVPTAFWEAAAIELASLKPLFMLAEDDSKYSLLNSAFDANYGFELMNLIHAVVNKTKTANDIRLYLEENLTRYPSSTFPVLYTTNHDINAWEGSIPELLGDAQEAMNVLMFTSPGMPMIYSGQEINLDKSLKFFDKDEIDWTGWETSETFDFYQTLIQLKKTNEALWHNSTANIEFIRSSTSGILCYKRTYGENQVIVLINLTSTTRSTQIEYNEAQGVYLEYFTNESTELDSIVQYSLSPWEYRVYITQ